MTTLEGRGTRILGARGEDLAAEFLAARGMRNFTNSSGVTSRPRGSDRAMAGNRAGDSGSLCVCCP